MKQTLKQIKLSEIPQALQHLGISQDTMINLTIETLDISTQPYQYQSQTFKDLLEEVEPISSDFNPAQAKAEYFREKYDV
jgi:hypothetical protein